MGKNAVQRAAKPRSDGASGKKAVTKSQLNVRVSSAILTRLQRLSKASGRPISWIVEHAICQSLEFNE